jgi:hypothetical protein
MNKETINCQVVMLPTEGKCRIAGKPTEKGQVPEGYRCYSHTGLLKRITKFFANGTPDPDYNTLYLNGYPNPEYNGYSEEYWHPQHLYFTSNEVIKEGDWVFCYSIHMNNPSHPPDRYINPIRKWNSGNCTACKKIIASTDPSLGLPAIPTIWIKDVFVSSNGSIKEVKLEKVENIMDGVLSVIGKGIRNPPAQSEYKLKLTEANEVVVVESTQYLEVQTPAECLKELECIGQDKELEEAALSYFMLHPLPNMQHKIENAFKAGAEWQKEQSANEAIEFADWLCENGWTSSPPMWVNGEASDDCISGQNTYTELTTQQLYELWQKTKE